LVGEIVTKEKNVLWLMTAIVLLFPGV